MPDSLILLDRDGVLNEMVVDAEHGTIDSPLHPDQVVMIASAVRAAATLTGAGYRLAIVTNQPASAKGKTTRRNLEDVHRRVVGEIERAGGRISSSHICFHRREDRCSCRKPATGLLDEAFRANAGFAPSRSWMVGDGVTDVEAGKAFGLRTAFVAPRKCEACSILTQRGLEPDLWVSTLEEFAAHLLEDSKAGTETE